MYNVVDGMIGSTSVALDENTLIESSFAETIQNARTLDASFVLSMNLQM